MTPPPHPPPPTDYRGRNKNCPFLHSGNGTKNADWWPEQVNVKILGQHNDRMTPLSKHFQYGEEFHKLDIANLQKDLVTLMTASQDWWPADYGHYGPFFVRMTWHAAGTYRVYDGRGGAGSGQIRFAPLNSWPDNGNLDKARRLLWPIKQKYGRSISWADLFVFAGNVALESMGFTTYGFAGGREDVWEPEEDVNWGQETTWLNGDKRYNKNKNNSNNNNNKNGSTPTTTTTTTKGELDDPLAAVIMGLIYVNPEGQDGNADPLDSAKYIRETFARMSMNDEETVALVAGGHTFGKCHGASTPTHHVGPEPEGAPLHEQGLGWKNQYKSGVGRDAITSGLEGAWNKTPTRWDNAYFDTLFGYEWELTTSPAGAKQWRPKYGHGGGTVPDAHDPTKFHPPMMLTTDLALRVDPKYAVISRRFHEHPQEFQRAFAKAWYKLTHRDMGPYVRCLGPYVPEPQLWQDPIPLLQVPPISSAEQVELKTMIMNSGLSVTRLVSTAWAAASTYRNSDKRGGANGGRIRLVPQRKWEVNEPKELNKVLSVLEGIQRTFNTNANTPTHARYVSIADLIVLGGNAAVEAAAKERGYDVIVPFTPGRTDASQDQTDIEQQQYLEPVADGFRNYIRKDDDDGGVVEGRAEQLLVDKAFQLALSAPEMTVLVGGLRVLGIGTGDTSPFTDRVGTLSNDFFVNLLDMGTVWSPVVPSRTTASPSQSYYEGRDRVTGRYRWRGSSVDLIFGSHSVLRSLAEVYASDDYRELFVRDFCAAFAKVMDLDRFDVNTRLNRSRM